ncbi:hypothetical protein [Actinomadura formosensis]|uniref:hypothetical protein n=1 Tax=Actinomadura formosensis TaxID=60706 RepID=UPI003D93415C
MHVEYRGSVDGALVVALGFGRGLAVVRFGVGRTFLCPPGVRVVLGLADVAEGLGSAELLAAAGVPESGLEAIAAPPTQPASMQPRPTKTTPNAGIPCRCRAGGRGGGRGGGSGGGEYMSGPIGRWCARRMWDA